MILLDGNKLTEREGMHMHLKEKLRLPEYYGCNLDALNDCLGERAERELIVIEDSGQFLRAGGTYATAAHTYAGETRLAVTLASALPRCVMSPILVVF